MKLQVTVVYSDGRRVEAEVSPRVKVEFERKFDRQWQDFFEPIPDTDKTRPGRLEWLYYLGYAALRAAEAESLDSFDTWLGQVDEVEMDVSPLDPTRRAPTPES